MRVVNIPFRVVNNKIYIYQTQALTQLSVYTRDKIWKQRYEPIIQNVSMELLLKYLKDNHISQGSLTISSH